MAVNSIVDTLASFGVDMRLTYAMINGYEKYDFEINEWTSALGSLFIFKGESIFLRNFLCMQLTFTKYCSSIE